MNIPEHSVWPWIAFNIFVVLMLVLDLLVFHRKAHVVKIKEALLWSGFWIFLALLFNLGIYFWQGPKTALEFFTGYLIEKSLSVDNLFVFLMIFSYFKVPAKYQHRVLFYGILGALIMRGVMIMIGVTLINEFHWILYIFGLFLVFTGIRMAMQRHDKELQPEKNLFVRLVKTIFPVTEGYHDGFFFIKKEGKYYATLLFIVLIVVETTDLVFAVDSIPAIFAITLDPFIVYTSNVFAILGLRALYFALAGMMNMFRYLKLGLSVILVFIGIKMLLIDLYHLPIGFALGFVGVVLAASIVASLFRRNVEGGVDNPTKSPNNDLTVE